MALGQEDLTRSIFRANRYFVGTESDDPAIANGGLGTEITDELLALIGFTGENVIFQGDSEVRVTDLGVGDITAKVDNTEVFQFLVDGGVFTGNTHTFKDDADDFYGGMFVGKDGAQSGQINLYGSKTGISGGGLLNLWNAFDYTGSFIAYQIGVNEDDLQIGPNTNQGLIQVLAGTRILMGTAAAQIDIDPDNDIVIIGDPGGSEIRVDDDNLQVDIFADGTLGIRVDDNGPKFYASGTRVASTITDGIGIGIDNSQDGLLSIYGDAAASTAGGELRLYTAADHDAAIDYFSFDVTEDDFTMGPNGLPTELQYLGGTNNWILSSSGTDVLNLLADVQRIGVSGDTFASFTQSTDIVSVQSGGDEMIQLGPITQRFGSTVLGEYIEFLQPIGENPQQMNTYINGRVRQAIFDTSGHFLYGYNTSATQQSYINISGLSFNYSAWTSASGTVRPIFRVTKSDGAQNTVSIDFDETSGQSVCDLVSDEGSPEGVISAPPGSAYFDQDGGVGVSAYLKESGTGNTGWQALLTAGFLAAGILNVGVDDTTRGVLTLFGDATTNGGRLVIKVDDSENATIEEFILEAVNDDLFMGPDTDPDALIYQGADGQWRMTNGLLNLGVDGVQNGFIFLDGTDVFVGGGLRLYHAQDSDSNNAYWDLSVGGESIFLTDSSFNRVIFEHDQATDLLGLGGVQGGGPYMIDILDTTSIAFKPAGTVEATINASGLALKTGGAVNEIETTITDDDTHIPTSGAVVDAQQAVTRVLTYTLPLTGVTDGAFPWVGTNELISAGETGDFTTDTAISNQHVYILVNSITTGGDIVITGTSISESTGLPVTSDTETITVDTTAAQYYQSTKKWWEITNVDITTGTIVGINYDIGRIGYVDLGNTDFKIIGYRLDALSSGADSDLRFIMEHVQDTGSKKMDIHTLEDIGVDADDAGNQIIDHLRTGPDDRSYNGTVANIWPDNTMFNIKMTDFDTYFTANENEIPASSGDTGFLLRIEGEPTVISSVDHVTVHIFYQLI